MRQAARLFQACLRHERIHIALDATWMNRPFSVTSDLCDTSSVSKGSEMEVRTNLSNKSNQTRPNITNRVEAPFCPIVATAFLQYQLTAEVKQGPVGKP